MTLPQPRRIILTATCAIALSTAATTTTAQVFHEHVSFVPSNLDPNDQFGDSVAISDNIVVVGSPYDDDSGQDSGAVFLFNAATGEQLHKLTASDPVPLARFGTSVAINNGIVAVGAIWDSSNGNESGSVYLFDAVSGSQLRKILPENGLSGALFGNAVDLMDGILAVGALKHSNMGSVFLFDVSSGQQLRQFEPASPAYNSFGQEVRIKNGLVAVVAHTTNAGPRQGTAYLFDAATGEELAALTVDGEKNDVVHGVTVAMDDGILALGIPGSRRDGLLQAGSVYLFDTGSGVQIAEIKPNAAVEHQFFGRSLAIDNGTLAVGALRTESDDSSAGAVYRFDTASHTELYGLAISNAKPGDRFGSSLAMSDGFILSGAQGVEGFKGSAYLFDFSCSADTNEDGMLNHDDFTAWLNAFNSATAACDQNRDGACTPTDFTAWIANFNAGC